MNIRFVRILFFAFLFFLLKTVIFPYMGFIGRRIDLGLLFLVFVSMEYGLSFGVLWAFSCGLLLDFYYPGYLFYSLFYFASVILVFSLSRVIETEQRLSFVFMLFLSCLLICGIKIGLGPVVFLWDYLGYIVLNVVLGFVFYPLIKRLAGFMFSGEDL